MQLDRRDCPDWMHIRQFVYLEKTSPRVLLAVVKPTTRERHKGERRTRDEHAAGQPRRRPINPAGMIRQKFPQKFPVGNKCALCGVDTLKGEDVAYWGRGPLFGHALCRIAEWTAQHDAAEAKRDRDNEHARRRRSLGA
jgi:hypothetical protein